MIKLQLKNLHKSFKNQTILSDISFSAHKGEVIAILGSSGSGKSTLLRCINFLTFPDEGTIQVDNNIKQFMQVQTKSPALTHYQIQAWRRKVGMVFQHFNLWSHMTILENLIQAPIYVLKQNIAETKNAAHELLVKMGLSEKANCYPVQLSGGQQQRVAIARALMMKPDIMLFDEPTSALDPEKVGEVLSVMQQLAVEGMTMIVATHELGFARQVANQAIFLDEGKIIEKGDTVEFFTRPKSIRLRHFLDAVQFKQSSYSE